MGKGTREVKTNSLLPFYCFVQNDHVIKKKKALSKNKMHLISVRFLQVFYLSNKNLRRRSE
ncbi:hypothetical protein B4110_0359 [Parageobacillus toebii]|uniref:Uncharacterized protein n=1 Tax=Parageobacillus toebii TaxID=153151 RepID=A0A150MAQ4_9BACL|nr:hypothetical protein B4110_0359 [Parageobacillus toebii]